MTMITEQIKNFAKESLVNLIQRYNATTRFADHSAGKKLLIPYIADEPIAVLSLEENLLFYCGYALISDDEQELRVLKCFLESDAFWYYIYYTSKPYSKGFMAFAKNYLINFSIPSVSKKEVQYLLSNPPKEELNKWIWRKYGMAEAPTIEQNI